MSEEKKQPIKWYLLDAKDKILGRLAVKIAEIIMGKHKPDYAPHILKGEGVIVINARQVKVTGEKLSQKFYRHYSGYPGGLKKIPLSEMLAKKPEEVIREAVKGMLPKNKLTKFMLRRLKIYPDEKHPHQAQKPILIG
ncbi:MAG: 50S ribosomal protein L13 [Candidatus Omnitrophica bacterium]|nr:50S ribosomal protein L13 [Candidatus Omnitrophota bacterium]MCM8793540.1 50S ribosomal protein L13 [Candidatus Omnitrophota bacterium]